MTDHTTPCQMLQECSTETKERLSAIEDKLDAVLEMAEVFQDGKGFFKTVRLISKGIAILGSGAALIAGAYHATKHFMNG